jgi:hypothetical protein
VHPAGLAGLGVVMAAALAATGSLLAHDPITTKVSWDREIAPIVQARCLSCHVPGGPAPMSLATYAEARPWARAIREEVLARRMPKWPVVRGFGDFSNDPSLSPFEIALITAWVDGGAPQTVVRPGEPARSVATPAVPLAPAPPVAAKTVTLPCATSPLPPGRLIGLRPRIAAGGSLEIIVEHPDGRATPLLWLRQFDPAFAQTYWLRTPLMVTRGTRVRLLASPGAPCDIAMLYRS